MAFINNTISKNDIFIRVGNVYDSNVGTLSTASTIKVNTTANYFRPDHLNQLVVFNNGQSKFIKQYISPTEVLVEPGDVEVLQGEQFTISAPSLTVDNDGRIIFGKAQPSSIMNGVTGIDLDFGYIRNSALPTNAHDLATKQYVDSLRIGQWNHIERFEGDGVTDNWTITVPISIKNAVVSVGGVIQEPYFSYVFEQFGENTRIKFYEAPPTETYVTIRTTTGTNISESTALEEIFIAADQQSTFILENEVYDKYGLMVSIDGVVQSTLNYDILTTPAGIRTVANSAIYSGNEYKILKFAEGLDLGATVRILNVRGRGFHSHSGTSFVVENTTLVPNTTYWSDNNYYYRDISNANSTFNITHDLIASRGGLNVYANTTLDNLYINLPEMGSEYSPDQALEVKVVKGTSTSNVFINCHGNNFMNYEGVFDGHVGGGVVYARQPDVPSVIHLEWESYYRTWYIKYGVGIWNVNANTISYPNTAPY